MTYDTIAIIPARMGSTRFPGKPLAPILGLPMVEHVRRRVMLAPGLDAVIVATPDLDILDVVNKFGGWGMMTSPKHERATDRIAEVAQRVTAKTYVMVQGDEPMTTPEMVEAVMGADIGRSHCINLATYIEDEKDRQNPNTIKVPVDAHSNALYFSRQPIPCNFKQVCVMAFTRQTLRDFAALSPTPLEQRESIDMLRYIESGFRVKMVPVSVNTKSVDTPDELEIVESLMRTDPLIERYLSHVTNHVNI